MRLRTIRKKPPRRESIAWPHSNPDRSLPVSSGASPRLRHHQPDHGKARRRNRREPQERDAAAEPVADIARQHGAERSADAGGGADDALREAEMTASESDIGDD